MRTPCVAPALVALALPLTAAAHLPHQQPTPYPFRCPQQGICMQATGEQSIIGGVRHGDEEIRFHAIYLGASTAAGEGAPAESPSAADANGVSDGSGGRQHAEKANDGNDLAADVDDSNGRVDAAADGNSVKATGEANASETAATSDANGVWCVMITAMDGKTLVVNEGGAACADLDQLDGALFGVKPTVAALAADEEPQDGAGELDAGTTNALEHLANSQARPDHADALGQVVLAAQRALAAQDSSTK